VSLVAISELFYKLFDNFFSNVLAENLFHFYNRFFDQNNIFSLQNSQYFIETKVNFHDLRCGAHMTSPTDLRTLSKYIVVYLQSSHSCFHGTRSANKHGSYRTK